MKIKLRKRCEEIEDQMPKQFQFGFCKHYTMIINKADQPFSILFTVFVHLLCNHGK